MRTRTRLLVAVAGILGVALAAVAVLTSPRVTGVTLDADRMVRTGPPTGSALFGVQLDWDRDGPDGYAHRLGRGAALYGLYTPFPVPAANAEALDHAAEQVGAARAIFMLTLEPFDGLSAVDDAALADLTHRLQAWNAAGTPVIVRFAHEMNGAWYPWGQQPAQFKQVFRAVADAVHAAPDSAMLWSPNEGGGYPFTGGRYEAQPGTADFATLDTDADGALTHADDPYAAYYPGDDVVDWVGLSLYHFGTEYPWGENEVPEPTKFLGKLQGTYQGSAVDERYVPDFYREYAVKHDKPMSISETSALFHAGSNTPGASDLEIKQAWWSQIFTDDLLVQYPQLKLITWFEADKTEADVTGGFVRWGVTDDPEVLVAFRRALPSWLVFER